MKTAESRAENGTVWFKSSYSNGAGGECVECAYASDAILVRDSKNDGGAIITVGNHAWQRFIRPMRQCPTRPDIWKISAVWSRSGQRCRRSQGA